MLLHVCFMVGFKQVRTVKTQGNIVFLKTIPFQSNIYISINVCFKTVFQDLL